MIGESPKFYAIEQKIYKYWKIILSMAPTIKIHAQEILHHLRTFWGTHEAFVTVNMFRNYLEKEKGLKMCWYTVEKKFHELERERLTESLRVFGYGSDGYTLVWRPTEGVEI